MSKPWVQKHAPSSAKEVVGHTQAIERLRQYVQNYTPGQKPVLLAGRPGIGKTSTVYALAADLDLELLEINASDERNKGAIESIIGGAIAQQSLFFRQKLILIDEVDGVSGNADRGGVAALVGLLPKSRHPIIFTANDAANDKLKPLVKASEVIELESPGHEHILALLERITAHEQVSVEKEQLSAICRRSGGDIRAAINDTQSLVRGSCITKEDVALLDERESREEVQQALLRVFKTTSAEVALPAFDNVDEDPGGLIMWIDENLPKEYKNPEDLARAFDALAEADRFMGRIRRWQYYRFYVYIYNLLSAGIATAKEKKYPGNLEYKQTSRILKMWIYNQKNAKRKKIAEVLAPQLHTSARRMRQELVFLKAAVQDKELKKKVIEQYGLGEEAEWFDKT